MTCHGTFQGTCDQRSKTQRSSQLLTLALGSIRSTSVAISTGMDHLTTRCWRIHRSDGKKGIAIWLSGKPAAEPRMIGAGTKSPAGGDATDDWSFFNAWQA